MVVSFMIGRVVPVTSLGALVTDLHLSFRKEFGDTRNAVKLVGLIFARPASALATEGILPHLGYLHERSKRNVFFYCAGYREREGADEGPSVVALGNGWTYSDGAFDNFRAEVEHLSGWVYSGGVDLILTNAEYKAAEPGALGRSPSVSLSFDSLISIPLDKLKQDANLPDIFPIFEQISRYAEKADGRDPMWGFSDAVGATLVGRALKEVLINALPEAVRSNARQAFYFAVVDTKRTRRPAGWFQKLVGWIQAIFRN
jgi:hypothetical protein